MRAVVTFIPHATRRRDEQTSKRVKRRNDVGRSCLWTESPPPPCCGSTYDFNTSGHGTTVSYRAHERTYNLSRVVCSTDSRTNFIGVTAKAPTVQRSSRYRFTFLHHNHFLVSVCLFFFYYYFFTVIAIIISKNRRKKYDIYIYI